MRNLRPDKVSERERGGGGGRGERKKMVGSGTGKIRGLRSPAETKKRNRAVPRRTERERREEKGRGTGKRYTRKEWEVFE